MELVSPDLWVLLRSHGWAQPQASVVDRTLSGLGARGYVINPVSREVISLMAGFTLDIRDERRCQPIDFDLDRAFWRASADFHEVYSFFGKPMSPVASVFANNGYLWCDDGAFYVTFWPGEILRAGAEFTTALERILFRNDELTQIGEIPDDYHDDDNGDADGD